MLDSGRPQRKETMLKTASAAAILASLCAASPALAQQMAPTSNTVIPPAPAANAPASISPETAPEASVPAPPPAGQPATVNEIVVTSTRVVRNGFQSPTPTSVITAQDIAEKAPANIANYVNELPSLVGSNTPQFNISSVSAGLSGINALNLRDLGSNRTLVLLDGQRVGPASLTDLVDINEFPEQLVKRVDVVTGGASADWGSDAVGGVVNFVLDRTFTGFKGELQGGATTYGDDGNYKIALTFGANILNGRGHVLLSFEDAYDYGVAGVPRPWATNSNELLQFANPTYTATNGQPALLVRNNSGFATATPGGIITAGPLRGTYFGQGGVPAQFAYGPIVSGNFMQGGQSAYANYANTGDLDPKQGRRNLFFRTSYDVTDHIQIFGQASYAEDTSFNRVANQWNMGNLTISAANPFIPTSTAAQIAAYNAANPATPITSFGFGTLNGDLPPITSTTDRKNGRFVGGANGDFNAFGTHWGWDTYAQETITDIYVAADLTDTSNYNAAINAVRNPTTGAIQCGTLATHPGCVPLDVFGTGVNNQAAIGYVMGNPYLQEQLNENVEAFNLHGDPFSDWAGPISVAAGFEHRRESAFGDSDPLDAAALESKPVVSPYFAGNFHPTFGSYSVNEGYFETVVPLARGVFLAKSLDFNGAVRETDYSTSGAVTTWKVGGTYTPVDDITFRATRSHDIRAPDLSELFQNALTISAGVSDPTRNNASSTVFQVTSGNLGLKPEQADTTEVGVILKPSFLSGFTASVDYYDITINDAITTLTAQQVVTTCAQGDTVLCSDIVRNASGAITQVNVTPVNFASQVSRGYDFEVDYRRKLETIASFLTGDLSLRGLATHFVENTINNGVSPAVNNVGDNSEGSASGTLSLPRWKYQASASWIKDPLNITFTARGVSAGVYNTTYIQCTTNCPTSTANHMTIEDNQIPGAVYFDASITYKLPYGVETYFAVDNLANTDPVQVAYGPGIGSAPLSINPTLYDTLGRVFRAGIRFQIQ